MLLWILEVIKCWFILPWPLTFRSIRAFSVQPNTPTVWKISTRCAPNAVRSSPYLSDMGWHHADLCSRMKEFFVYIRYGWWNGWLCLLQRLRWSLSDLLVWLCAWQSSAVELSAFAGNVALLLSQFCKTYRYNHCLTFGIVERNIR